MRKYVVTQIQSLGYRTLAASNGSEAMAIIDSAEQIDLLFTDVVMPGPLNGRQLAIAALSRRPLLKVLYTSGYARNVWCMMAISPTTPCCSLSRIARLIWRA